MCVSRAKQSAIVELDRQILLSRNFRLNVKIDHDVANALSGQRLRWDFQHVRGCFRIWKDEPLCTGSTGGCSHLRHQVLFDRATTA
jgi:hypothetical protein